MPGDDVEDGTSLRMLGGLKIYEIIKSIPENLKTLEFKF
jgi:hypothetical protein